MKILVLGASGMIGNTMLRVLSDNRDWRVHGTVRSKDDLSYFSAPIAAKILECVDLLERDTVSQILGQLRPEVVINCAGLTKHLPAGNNPASAIAMNALLPHVLAETCDRVGSRLIHISTDCVFSGRRGNYSETDLADADDVYGRSKRLGEVELAGHLTLRTSTIGHENHTKFGLLEWFLAQRACKGYARAIFSGLPSVVFARIIRDIVIPDAKLTGLYHVSAAPIGKYDLLQLIAEVYNHRVDLAVDQDFVINRSLNSNKFTNATGYQAPAWPELIQVMHEHAVRELNIRA
jgi:dTDP-4-dehydrorhamnose reductase